MKPQVLAFLALLAVGLVGSLQSLPPEEHREHPREAHLAVEKGFTLIRGYIETIDRTNSRITVRTQGGGRVSVPMTRPQALTNLAKGDRVEIEVQVNANNELQAVTATARTLATITL